MIASAVACVLVGLIGSSMGFDPVTLTVGTTAYVLTGTQVAVGVAALAGLAIAKEKLAIAALSRGKRDLTQQEQETLSLDPFFMAIGQVDVSQCGKLLVCHVMATPATKHAAEEKLIANLFDDLENINPNTHRAAYQFAAYVGTLGQPGLCRQRYSRCPAKVSELLQVVEAHSGNAI